jgi:hypothetical protein
MTVKRSKLMLARRGLVWRRADRLPSGMLPWTCGHPSPVVTQYRFMPMKSPVETIFAPLLPIVKQAYSSRVQS